MKRFWWSIVLLFVASIGFAQTIDQIAAKAPNPPRLVNDFAHVMTADQIGALEQKLVAYDDSTSIQIAVVTVQTTGDYAIEDAALKILRSWGVGNKRTNNGIVVLAAVQDHKVFIATGYGMEGSIPDITAKEIIDNEVVPNFKQNNFYRGFDEAADALIKAAAGEYKAPPGYHQQGSGGGVGKAIGIFIFIIVIAIVLGRGRGGGGRGGGLGSGTGWAPWIIASMLSNRGGGGFGGGGFGGFGGGGGGFGGFGGGSGGGGGAGGSW